MRRKKRKKTRKTNKKNTGRKTKRGGSRRITLMMETITYHKVIKQAYQQNQVQMGNQTILNQENKESLKKMTKKMIQESSLANIWWMIEDKY